MRTGSGRSWKGSARSRRGARLTDAGEPSREARISEHQEDEQEHLEPLPPGASKSYDATLVGGRHGPLAPDVGAYRVALEVHWFSGGQRVLLRNSVPFDVTDPGEAATKVATRLLAQPEVLLRVAVGCRPDSSPDSFNLIGEALDCPPLGAHYDVIEAKTHLREALRLLPPLAADGTPKPTGQTVRDRLTEIAQHWPGHLKGDTVVSGAELNSVVRLLEEINRRSGERFMANHPVPTLLEGYRSRLAASLMLDDPDGLRRRIEALLRPQ